MAAVVTILRGPAGAGKTAALVERCRAHPRGTLWLAPTRRAAEALRRRLFLGLPPLDGPWLGTMQDFADGLVCRHDPRARPLSNAQRRLIVDAMLANLH